MASTPADDEPFAVVSVLIPPEGKKTPFALKVWAVLDTKALAHEYSQNLQASGKLDANAYVCKAGTWVPLPPPRGTKVFADDPDVEKLINMVRSEEEKKRKEVERRVQELRTEQEAAAKELAERRARGEEVEEVEEEETKQEKPEHTVFKITPVEPKPEPEPKEGGDNDAGAGAGAGSGGGEGEAEAVAGDDV